MDSDIDKEFIEDKILKLNQLGVHVVYGNYNDNESDEPSDLSNSHRKKQTKEESQKVANKIKQNGVEKTQLTRDNEIEIYGQNQSGDLEIEPRIKDGKFNGIYTKSCGMVEADVVDHSLSGVCNTALKGNESNKEFILKPGLKVSVSETPIDYFYLLTNKNFFKHLLEETNRNLNNINDGTEWTNATWAEEMMRFLGLLFHMGTIQLNRIVDYWSQDSLFNITCISKHMTRNRFMILLKCVQHSSLVEHFNKTMLDILTAQRILTIQEPLYYVEGRFKKQNFINNDQDKVSVHCVNQPDGIILKIVISNRITDDVVDSLLKELLYSNRCLYVHPVYSSVKLANKLIGQSTYCTGFLPKDTLSLANMVQDKPLIFIVKNDTLIGRYKKDCTVFFSSQFTNMDNIENEVIPEPLREYYKYMRNNEKLHDELLSFYTCERRPMSLEKKLFIHVLQIMLMNAYYMYNSKNANQITLYDFRLEVIRELIQSDVTLCKNN